MGLGGTGSQYCFYHNFAPMGLLGERDFNIVSTIMQPRWGFFMWYVIYLQDNSHIFNPSYQIHK